MNRKKFSYNLLTFIKSSLLKNKTKGINERTLLFEEGLINSMKIIELIAYIEKALGIEVKDDKMSMEFFGSVEKIANTFVPNEKK